MSNTELKSKIYNLIKGVSMGSFASIKDNKPWVRYVMVNGEEDLSLYFTTSNSSRKIQQIQETPDCHIILGGDAQDFTKPYLQVAGKAQILKDMETKKKFWNDYLSNMFKGVDDPDYVVVKIVPEVIELWDMSGRTPEIYKA